MNELSHALSVAQDSKGPVGLQSRHHVLGANGRHTYWRSQHPIPGGIAFENFEMRERFYEGQRFIFGITRRTPGDLDFGPARDDRPARTPGSSGKPGASGE